MIGLLTIIITWVQCLSISWLRWLLASVTQLYLFYFQATQHGKLLHRNILSQWGYATSLQHLIIFICAIILRSLYTGEESCLTGDMTLFQPPTVVCSICKRDGHLKDECPEDFKKIELKPLPPMNDRFRDILDGLCKLCYCMYSQTFCFCFSLWRIITLKLPKETWE